MKTIKLASLPFTFLAAAVLLGGCVGAEPIEGDEADESTVEVESTAEAEEALGPQASAAVYNGACGSGYSVIDSSPVSGGTVYLTYNSSTGKNCVVTVRNTPGTQLYMCALVALSSASLWNKDCDYYTTYAGPVYVYAPNTCIDWGGAINGSTFYKFDSHCG